MTNKKISPTIAGATGAVVGAGVAVAASKLLTNKKAMKTIGKTLKTVAEEATDTAKTYQTKVIKGGKTTIKKLGERRGRPRKNK